MIIVVIKKYLLTIVAAIIDVIKLPAYKWYFSKSHTYIVSQKTVFWGVDIWVVIWYT